MLTTSLFNNRPIGVFKYVNILVISAYNLDNVGGMFSNFKQKHMAANLADVLPQTRWRWVFHWKIFNTVTDSTPNNVSDNPFYKLQKIKRI
jgi:hypothetical protein